MDVASLKKMLSNYEKARNEGLAPRNSMLEDLLNSVSLEDGAVEHLRLPGENQQEDDRAQEIIPEPFFVVKSSDQDGRKVFINMCGCCKVAAPGEWQNGVPSELENSFSLANFEVDQGSQNLRFSLSCSDPVSSVDNRGNPCKVYDVVFNDDVLRHAMCHKQLKAFLINMALTWISKKYDIELNDDFKLPNAKYKGKSVRKHYIRAAKAKLVTEMHDTPDDLEPSFPLVIDRSDMVGNLKDENSKSSRPDESDKYDENVEIGRCLMEENAERKALEREVPFGTENSQAALNTNLNLPCNLSKETDGLSLSHQELDVEKSRCMEKGNGRTRYVPASPQTDLCVDKTRDAQEQINVYNQLETLSPLKILFQVNFIGHPVEAVVLQMSFPSAKVELQDLKVSASNSMVYIQAGSSNPISVPLLFLTSPVQAKASFFSLGGLLEVYLPYVPYSEVLEIYEVI